MKAKTIKRIAAGIFAAAMVLSCSPAVSNAVKPTVTAQARSNFHFISEGTLFMKGYGLLPGKYSLDEIGDFGVYYGEGLQNVSNVKFSTNSKDLKLTKKTLTAKKPGTYKIKIKAKFKGRSASKTVKAYIANVALKNTSSDMCIGQTIDAFTFLKNDTYGKLKCTVTEGNDIVTLNAGDEAYYITANKEGTAQVNITDAYGHDGGTVTITVGPNHVTDITTDNDRYENSTVETYVGQDPYQMSDYYKLCTTLAPDGDYTNYDYDEVMKNIADEITVTSSDPGIFEISGSGRDAIGTPVSAGNATVTVSANGHSYDINFRVYADRDDYENAY